MTDTDYNLDEQVGFLLRKAGQRHLSICHDLLGGTITAVQFSVLYRLVTIGEPVSQNALGRMVAMDAATTKGVIARLKERGLITVTQDAEDRRKLLVAPTDLGHATLTSLLPVMAQITEATLAPLEFHEQVTLIALLQKIA